MHSMARSYSWPLVQQGAERDVQGLRCLHIDAALPCGLILNELLTNSFKYAFAKRNGGQILIAGQISAGAFELAFRDNGVREGRAMGSGR